MSLASLNGSMKARRQCGHTTAWRQRSVEMAIAVEPGCSSVVLPLEFVLDGRFPCHLQNRPVAVAHLAIGAVNHQCGQRGDTLIVAAVH